VLFASTAPDGIERLTRFDTASAAAPWLNKAAAGLGGIALIYALCFCIGRLVARPTPARHLRVGWGPRRRGSA
jgi:hypothetical protein